VTNALPYVVTSWRFPAEIRRDDSHFLGGKAVGMLRLPPKWVPPFIILTSSFHELLQHSKAKKVFESLPTDEFDLVRDYLASLSNSSSRVLVRSNAIMEGRLSTAGQYVSEATNADLDSVSEAVDRVCGSGLPDSTYAVLQECIEPAMVGHMSNERRVSFERSLWLVEGLVKKGPTKIRAYGGDVEIDILKAYTEDNLLRTLRKVASYLYRLEQGYFHCEWVWDGQRVWVVQSDACPPSSIAPAANEYIRSSSRDVTRFVPNNPRLRHFLDVIENRWKKLKRPTKFHELGLPYADVYLLTGEDWGKSKSEDFMDLLPDLRDMCVEPVIARCDVSVDIEAEDLFLPTSSPTTNPEKLLVFMDSVSKYFKAQGISEKDWALLLARVVPARASAMIHARPEAQLIQIDALWGYPDGLLYYPHDTYFYHLADGKITEVRCYKSFCLLCTEETWTTLPIIPPLDWGHVLASAEVKVLAKWALSIANSIGHEIQLMALVRVCGRRGEKGCLPWHYTQLEIAPYAAVTQRVPQLGTMLAIRTRADIESFKTLEYADRIDGFVVRPDIEVLRDAEFLRDAAGYAASLGIPVYFEGSLLGHSYYQMVKTGARVIPLADVRPPVEITRYEKIVRDFIPAIIRRAGGVARVRTLHPDEAITLLTQKLIEESYEAWQSDREHLAEELADILEVVDSLRQHIEISGEELEHIRENKRVKRGGFQNLVFLEETSNQALELSGTQPETIPLFLEEDLVASGQRGRKFGELENQPLAIELGKDSREIVRIVIPLVPPVKRGHKVRSLESRMGDYNLQVNYERTQLIVTISPAIKETPAEQLPLFPDMGGFTES
jgi:predicted house-cleaning noncanonical NTP pyrophosphatase (MazG superfamily)